MGCYNVTCALTGLPISEYQQIVIITLKDLDPIFTKVLDKKAEGIKFKTIVVDRTPTIDDLIVSRSIHKIESIKFGTYDDYGWINENVITKDGEHLRSFYFLKWAWDWCLSFNELSKTINNRHTIIKTEFKKIHNQINSLKDQELEGIKTKFRLMSAFEDWSGIDYTFIEQIIDNEDTWKNLAQLEAVLNICFQMRKDPLTMNNFVGFQINYEALILTKRLLPYIQNHIAKIEKKFNENSTEPFDDLLSDFIGWPTRLYPLNESQN